MARDTSADSSNYCRVSEVLKLINEHFSGDKKMLKEFIKNVEAAFELVNPDDREKLLKFVKAKITGDAKAKLLARTSSNKWQGIKDILEENYSVRSTLDFYACRMFSAPQGKSESVVSWGNRVDTLQTELKEAAFKTVRMTEAEGAQALIHHLSKACFMQELADSRMQTIVHSKSVNICSLGDAVEVALEEESTLVSQEEKLIRRNYTMLSPEIANFCQNKSVLNGTS
ncbi:hypothetical protein PR048_011555 [Dryococelus australis]|uniref:Uncharacterized protein n=1 Tax=Dryococelus australis TaxID=614101 RepID=A0ABQ9HLX7_9NEOP|nr:hypothetical protein PR048_011555 [Dryococelus australis]